MRRRDRLRACVLCGWILIMSAAGAAWASDSGDLNAQEIELGELLFHETALSTPPGQACVDCHDAGRAFNEPELGLPVSQGVRTERFGNRNSQPVKYASFIPPLHKDPEEGIWVGGLFWDGRVNTLEEQAMGPPLNPVEMANADTLTIANTLRNLEYADEFYEVYGPDALADPTTAYTNMAKAIAAFERTEQFHPFNSKYDLYLKGEVELTEQEKRGLHLFEAEDKGNCAACHPSQLGEDGSLPQFTDFTYDNLGTPKNPANPHYLMDKVHNPDGFEWVDRGLGVTVDDPAEDGKFRVPTLRNIALTGPYMHNGVFHTLFDVVAFYNTRDIGSWPPPEVAATVNKEELGNLKLTNNEMDDLVVFMETLTDDYGLEEDDD